MFSRRHRLDYWSATTVYGNFAIVVILAGICVASVILAVNRSSYTTMAVFGLGVLVSPWLLIRTTGMGVRLEADKFVIGRQFRDLHLAYSAISAIDVTPQAHDELQAAIVAKLNSGRRKLLITPTRMVKSRSGDIPVRQAVEELNAMLDQWRSGAA